MMLILSEINLILAALTTHEEETKKLLDKASDLREKGCTDYLGEENLLRHLEETKALRKKMLNTRNNHN